MLFSLISGMFIPLRNGDAMKTTYHFKGTMAKGDKFDFEVIVTLKETDHKKRDAKVYDFICKKFLWLMYSPWDIKGAELYREDEYIQSYIPREGWYHKTKPARHIP